ncbi:hypothetical protein DJ568_15995 [Mucilaginibacter hurinus]|uniref:AsmA-like C-terminal domain-containing protein n=1 Tax=Mucilaginibacter hurinus TaxID=2201324 RepID=A0A367GK96_9SPHI|nr:hypothetical protein [Mucilaginibacter hurinus]RCH53740.1 hypothetical protein DJ568_15995 [Mucilaginibacter hurinus]
MIKQFLKHRWQRVIFYTVLVIAIVAILLTIATNLFVVPALQNKLKTSIRESSDSLYIVNYNDADISLLQGNITLTDATLKVDSAVYKKKKSEGTAPNNLYNVSVKQLRLTGVKGLKLYFSKKADVGKIVLNEPEIEMSYEANNPEDSASRDKRTIWQRISKSLQSVQVGEILLNNLKFKHVNYARKKPLTTVVKEVNLRAVNLLIDSATQADTSRFFYCKDLITEVSNYSGRTGNGLYTYALKNIKFSTRTARLNVQGIVFKPHNSLLFFTKTRSERFNLKLDSLNIDNFDFTNYYKYRTFSASKVTLSKGTLDVFGAPNKIPNYTRENVGSFPHMAIRKLDFGLKIDTVSIKKLHIIYSELNNDSKKKGTLVFGNTAGQMLNLTNNKAALKRNNLARVNLTTYFMDRGRLDVRFVLNLTAADASFSYKGSLGPMKLSSLNRAIMPISMVKVTSGVLKRFDFDVDANRYRAKGKMTLLYNDLNINILKLDDGRLKKKGLMSMMANAFIIERNNPDEPGKAPRSANITYVRPVSYPFFKIAWKTLFAGVKECAGVSEMDEKKANAKMSEGDLEKQKKKE